mgnify:CR=1 FL=1
MALVDTGPWVALFDPQDEHHSRCRKTLGGAKESLFTTAPVVTEAFHRIVRIGTTPVFIWTLWMLLLMFGIPATSNASVNRQDLAGFLLTDPQPEDYTQSINPIIVILKTTGHDRGPRAAGARLANDWRIPSSAAQALIELVVLPDWEYANRAARKRRRAWPRHEGLPARCTGGRS